MLATYLIIHLPKHSYTLNNTPADPRCGQSMASSSTARPRAYCSTWEMRLTMPPGVSEHVLFLEAIRRVSDEAYKLLGAAEHKQRMRGRDHASRGGGIGPGAPAPSGGRGTPSGTRAEAGAGQIAEAEVDEVLNTLALNVGDSESDGDFNTDMDLDMMMSESAHSQV